MGEEIETKVQDMKEAKLVLKNIKAGEEIERFKFTEKETLAIDFAINLLDANLKSLEE